MTHPMTMLTGALDEGGIRLVGADTLRGPMGLLRAQVTSLATILGPDGVIWTQHLSDVPRFRGTARRLLIEGQRTNAVRNPRLEGGAAGTPGTLPTNVGTITSYRGLTQAVGAAGKAGGIDYVDVGASGTASSAGPVVLQTELRNIIAAVAGETWTGSLFLALPSGAPTNITEFRVSIYECDAAGVPLAAVTDTVLAPGALSATMQRITVTRTLSNASTVFVVLTFTAVIAATATATAWTLRVGWPQLERAPFASTPILPPVGTPGASTRGGDLVSATMASLGVTGACTVLWSGVVGQAAPSGADQALFQLDSGSDGSRLLAAVHGGTTNIRTRNADATLTSDAGAMVPGSPFAVGMSLDGTGNASILRAGGKVQAITGAPTGLTTLRLGNNAAGTAPIFGEVKCLRVLPFAIPGTQLEAALANLG